MPYAVISPHYSIILSINAWLNHSVGQYSLVGFANTIIGHGCDHHVTVIQVPTLTLRTTKHTSWGNKNTHRHKCTCFLHGVNNPKFKQWRWKPDYFIWYSWWKILHVYTVPLTWITFELHKQPREMCGQYGTWRYDYHTKYQGMIHEGCIIHPHGVRRKCILIRAVRIKVVACFGSRCQLPLRATYRVMIY